MRVLVNGIGNIGTSLLHVLNAFKEELGIVEIYAHKNTAIHPWKQTELNLLSEAGIILCARNKVGMQEIDEVIGQVDYVFDCTTNKMGLANKKWYESLKQLKGMAAQGSEKGFGIPYMLGVNDAQIQGQKAVQIVSCNTHALSALLETFVPKRNLADVEADFVVVRRSEDLGQHERLVSANVVSRHLDQNIGTHHAIDVKDLYATLNLELKIQSSDITTPSQLMHVVRFHIQSDHLRNEEQIQEYLKTNPFVASTSKFDSNVLFELGRRYSPQGRLYSHAIINLSNLLYSKDQQTIKGWAFIPQEGNTLLSTIKAFMLQTKHTDTEGVMDKIAMQYVRSEW